MIRNGGPSVFRYGSSTMSTRPVTDYVYVGRKVDSSFILRSGLVPFRSLCGARGLDRTRCGEGRDDRS